MPRQRVVFDMTQLVHRWGAWALVVLLTAVILFQRQQVVQLRQTEQLYDDKLASMFPYALRRADFASLPATLEQLAQAQELEETIRLFKQAQTLAVGFTDDLLVLNNLRHSGPPLAGRGLHFGEYKYAPATPAQEALQWKILKTRFYGTLWSMERKFYVNEGVLEPADREALRTLALIVQAIAEQVRELRVAIDAPGPYGVEAAARGMEEMSPLLDQIDQVATAYEASLPPMQFKPGGLYDRLYGTKPSGG